MFLYIQRVERELHGKQPHTHNHFLLSQCGIMPQEQSPSSTASTTTLPHMTNIDIATQQQQQGIL